MRANLDNIIEVDAVICGITGNDTKITITGKVICACYTNHRDYNTVYYVVPTDDSQVRKIQEDNGDDSFPFLCANAFDIIDMTEDPENNDPNGPIYEYNHHGNLNDFIGEWIAMVEEDEIVEVTPNES